MADKQIIERLKTDLDFERSKRKTLQSELTVKEQECEAYKMEAEEGKEINAELKAENEECIKDNEYLKTIINVFTQEVVKLKQTLTEIKEIIKFNKVNRLSGGADISIEQILQKISEVLDGQ